MIEVILISKINVFRWFWFLLALRK